MINHGFSWVSQLGGSKKPPVKKMHLCFQLSLFSFFFSFKEKNLLVTFCFKFYYYYYYYYCTNFLKKFWQKEIKQ